MRKKYKKISDYFDSKYRENDWIYDHFGVESEDESSSYNDWSSLINIYYDSKTYVDETEEQKEARLAKEKAVKRNNKIDQILGDDR